MIPKAIRTTILLPFHPPPATHSGAPADTSSWAPRASVADIGRPPLSSDAWPRPPRCPLTPTTVSLTTTMTANRTITAAIRRIFVAEFPVVLRLSVLLTPPQPIIITDRPPDRNNNRCWRLLTTNWTPWTRTNYSNSAV
ncbi:ORFL161C.iORF2 [Human betaherpesvirus 5]|nr:ORFL161C.iORF2 [Human betaherpesvirus 5]QHX40493.1 ORFL161C.iORF2 [Human betaherpesvirus 5]